MAANGCFVLGVIASIPTAKKRKPEQQLTTTYGVNCRLDAGDQAAVEEGRSNGDSFRHQGRADRRRADRSSEHRGAGGVCGAADLKARNTERQRPLVDPIIAWKQARGFAQAANYLLTLTPSAPRPGDTAAMSFISPHITCMAFALELYLKLLIRVETGKNAPALHDLCLLFDRLSGGAKATIEDLWSRHGAVAHFRATRVGEGEYSFESSLRESAKAFEEWRYASEAEPCNWTASPIVAVVDTYLAVTYPAELGIL